MAVSSEYIPVRLRALPYYTGTKALDGIPFRFTVKWNNYLGVYHLDLESLTDEDINLKGIALLPGKNLFAPHGYAHLLGELWLEDTSGQDENPTFSGLGDRWQLRYYPLVTE